jgi:hypothetical protein
MQPGTDPLETEQHHAEKTRFGIALRMTHP